MPQTSADGRTGSICRLFSPVCPSARLPDAADAADAADNPGRQFPGGPDMAGREATTSPPERMNRGSVVWYRRLQPRRRRGRPISTTAATITPMASHSAWPIISSANSMPSSTATTGLT